jgi:hypothetical protein
LKFFNYNQLCIRIIKKMSPHRIRGIKMMDEARREQIARREYQQDIYVRAIVANTTILPEHALLIVAFMLG